MKRAPLDSFEDQRPAEFCLYQNQPNPFSAYTEIRFATPKACHLRLVLYNHEHELVHVLHDGPTRPGQHTLVWDGMTADGEHVADGFYTYRLEAKDFVAARKLEINCKLQTGVLR